MINKTINAVCDICNKVETVWYTGEVSDEHVTKTFIEELKRDGWDLGYNYLSLLDQIKCPSCVQSERVSNDKKTI